MLQNYQHVLVPEIDEVSGANGGKLWILQRTIDAIDSLKEQLERPTDKNVLCADGMRRPALSPRKVAVLRLIYAALKLNYQPINISISLSGLFSVVYVG